MAINYTKSAKEIIKAVGGDENINSLTHCATRLRFILNDDKIVNKDEVNKIEGVITTMEAGGQFQVVIGNHVKDVYELIMQDIKVDDSKASNPNNKNKVGVFSRIIDVISSIFAPFLYTLAACGILQGLFRYCWWDLPYFKLRFMDWFYILTRVDCDYSSEKIWC